MGKVVTMDFGNCIVRVHHPDLTPEERERIIEKEIKPVLAWFGRRAMERGIDLAAWAKERESERKVGKVIKVEVTE